MNHGFRTAAVALALICTAVSVESVISCEPGGEIDLYARALAMMDQGSQVLVTVELTIVPRRSLESARVHGWLANGSGIQRVPGVQDRTETLRRGLARKLQYEITLDKGVDHQLFFGVGPDADPSAEDLSTAWLRMNLDPSKQPEDLGDVLQFRAVAGGR